MFLKKYLIQIKEVYIMTNYIIKNNDDNDDESDAKPF